MALVEQITIQALLNGIQVQSSEINRYGHGFRFWSVLREFSEMEGCSFILVEKDDSMCKLLAGRLKVRRYDTSHRSVRSALGKLRSGSGRYHILNCCLEEVPSDQQL